MKYVINKCYGGFGLSFKALRRLYELGAEGLTTPAIEYFGTSAAHERAIEQMKQAEKEGNNNLFIHCLSADYQTVLCDSVFSKYEPNGRCNPLLVQVVEELGEEANGACAKLGVVEVPDGVEVEITEYDGIETIREASRYFG